VSKIPQELRLRPLIRALRDDTIVAKLRDLHCYHFQNQDSWFEEIRKISPEFAAVSEDNSYRVPSAKYGNLSALMGWLGDVSDLIISMLPKPACRTRRDVEVALRAFIFCHPSFDECYSLFVDAVLNQQVWPHPLEGKLFTPAAFLKSSTRDQQVEKRIARLHPLCGLSASAEGDVPLVAKAFNHHPFESAEIKVECRISSGDNVLVGSILSDHFSHDASVVCIDDLCSMVATVVRSFEMMDGNLECFSEDIVSVSESIGQLPSIVEVIVETIWCYKVRKKQRSLFGRIKNALQYLSAADVATSSQVRLALSFAALESILSDSKTEIARSLAERSATLLRPSHNRTSSIRALKKLYDFRSRFLHGDDPAIGSEYLSRITRSVAGSVLVRSVFWVEFSRRMGRDLSSDTDFIADLDDAFKGSLRISGLDSEDDKDWCPPLTGFESHLNLNSRS